METTSTVTAEYTTALLGRVADMMDIDVAPPGTCPGPVVENGIVKEEEPGLPICPGTPAPDEEPFKVRRSRRISGRSFTPSNYSHRDITGSPSPIGSGEWTRPDQRPSNRGITMTKMTVEERATLALQAKAFFQRLYSVCPDEAIGLAAKQYPLRPGAGLEDVFNAIDQMTYTAEGSLPTPVDQFDLNYPEVVRADRVEEDTQASMFPLIDLPSVRRRADEGADLVEPARQQIRDFFNSPVPAVFAGTGDAGSEFSGVIMEYQLRRLLGTTVGGLLKQLAGWWGVDTQTSRWVTHAHQQLMADQLKFLLNLDTEERPPKSEARSFLKDEHRQKRLKRHVQKLRQTLKHKSVRRRRSSSSERSDEAPIRHKPRIRSKRKREPSSDDSFGRGSPVAAERINGKRLRRAPAVLDHPPKQIGDVASHLESQWDGPESIRNLYGCKNYLTAGLYSTAFKTDGLPRLRTRDPSKGFKFPLPLNYGMKLLGEEADFDLPYDIMKYAVATNATQEQPHLPNPMQKPASHFTRILKNIFVDRKSHKPKERPICACDVPADGEYACGDNCLNRCMYIECSPTDCPAGEKCSNQRFQRRESVEELEVFWTAKRGHGLKTRVNIPRGQLVIEYRGEIISQDTCIERMETMYKSLENYYFLDYAPGEVIDACRKGTEARFVNHSCEPNCHIEKWQVDGEWCIGVFSTEDIFAGSELTYDYRFQAFGPMQRCLCGAQNCRGFIGVNKKNDAAKKANTTETATVAKPKPKPKPPVVKQRRSLHERTMWQRKHRIQKLQSCFENALKHRRFYASTRFLLVRNLCSVARKELGSRRVMEIMEDVISTKSAELVTNHRFITSVAESTLQPSQRNRSLSSIVDDLWERRKADFPEDAMGTISALEGIERMRSMPASPLSAQSPVLDPLSSRLPVRGSPSTDESSSETGIWSDDEDIPLDVIRKGRVFGVAVKEDAKDEDTSSSAGVDESGFACSQCHKMFPTAANLRYHEKFGTHDETSMLMCDSCGEQFGDFIELDDHQKVCASSMNTFRCKCGQECDSASARRHHRKRDDCIRGTARGVGSSPCVQAIASAVPKPASIQGCVGSAVALKPSLANHVEADDPRLRRRTSRRISSYEEVVQDDVEPELDDGALLTKGAPSAEGCLRSSSISSRRTNGKPSIGVMAVIESCLHNTDASLDEDKENAGCTHMKVDSPDKIEELLLENSQSMTDAVTLNG